MSYGDAEATRVGEPPSWLDTATVRLMETERNKAFVWGRDARAAAEMVRQVLLARRPALPMTMIDEAVAAVVPDADGRSYAVAAAPDGELAATREEMAETLAYALRFGLDGKPRKVGTGFLALSDLASRATAASLSMRLAAATSRAMRSRADS